MREALHLLPILLLGMWLGAAPAAEPGVKPAGIAGSWYPADAAQLGELIDQLVDKAEPIEPAGALRALISPHAAYHYSGPTAAAGYRLLRGATPRRVLVLAPAHRGGFRGLSIAPVTAYETPLGRIELDLEAVQALRQSPLVGAHAPAHQGEHSIEIQLPFLQRVLAPGWRLVPILVGQVGPDEQAAAAQLLQPLADEETLVLVSSDFTHYGARFGYQPFPPDARAAQRLRDLDMGALGPIARGQAEDFRAYRRKTGITVCGGDPILILLEMLPSGRTGTLLAYDTSGALTGSYTNSVSYLSIGFFAPAAQAESAGSERLDVEQLQYLHRLARYALWEAVEPGNGALEQLRDLVAAVPEGLRQPAGVFVTVRNRGRLRGCQGYVEPEVPLFEAVIQNSVSASRYDHRFYPVAPDELPDLELEVSVLSDPVPLASHQAYRPGRDGIVLEKDGKRAVFLPEVPIVAGWNREQTLDALAEKAGLPADAWKQEGARLLVFRTHKYQAPFAASGN